MHTINAKERDNMIYKAIQGLPQAHARIKGSKEYPDIRGNVYLYEVYNGTVLLGELIGIPEELEKNIPDMQEICRRY